MYSKFIFLYAVRMSGWLYHDETIPKKNTETKKYRNKKEAQMPLLPVR